MNKLVLKDTDKVLHNFFYNEYLRLLDEKDGSVTCCFYKSDLFENDYLVRYNRISKVCKHDYIVYSYKDKVIKDVSLLSLHDDHFFNNYSCISFFTNDNFLKNVSLSFFDMKD